ncbi:MAG: histidine phosphatase family protein [Lachnospiraceae bacterium]|nr:histidine phosphatase family protein [Lachnospiraceae bacterium]
MKIYLIRHGMTQGNAQKRYIGKTDEPLCEEGIRQLAERTYPEAEVIYVSPLKRCIQTAKQIYGRQKMILCDGLREMDFGLFENKNYEELKDNPDYIRWLESGGESAFPEGEGKSAFTIRCQNAFEECLKQLQTLNAETAAFVVHGGTIMAIMEKYGTPKGEYYRWQLQNGEWLELQL